MSVLRAIAAALVALDSGDADHARDILCSATGATARLPSGRYQGWTIAEMYALPGFGRDWLRWALQPRHAWNGAGSANADFAVALRRFAAAYEPALLETTAAAEVGSQRPCEEATIAPRRRRPA